MYLTSKAYKTLFLDRDGVINHRPLNDYVKSWDQFKFLPGVLDAIKILSGFYQRIIIITNQQGVGKNIMSDQDLEQIHQKMLEEIIKYGGHVDAIYYCPDISTKQDNCRKPGLKMAEKARNEFPEIDFNESIMVGDTKPDMQFGKNAGMTTVYVGIEDPDEFKLLIDHQFKDLSGLASYLLAND